jgi:hypothetical protein
MFRSLLAAALLSGFALLAVARSEIVHFYSAAEPVPTNPINLSGFDSVAVWGVGEATLNAGVLIGTLIDPVLEQRKNNPLQVAQTPDERRWTYTLGGGAPFYGAIEAVPTLSSATGEGFNIVLLPDELALTSYEIWAQANGGAAQVSVSTLWGETLQSLDLPSSFYGRIFLGAIGEPIVLSGYSTAGGMGPNAARFTLGAVTGQVVAVPEPGLFLAGIVLAVFVTAWYWAVVLLVNRRR